MKIYYVVRIDSCYEDDEDYYGAWPEPLSEIVTEETPLLDEGIFANKADAVVLVGDLLRKENAMWERYSDCDPAIVGNKVYARREDMETFPARFTEFTVREREVIGS